MLLIVIFHSILAWNNTWFSVIGLTYRAPIFEVISAWLSTFHVYTFAGVSGYIFYYCKYERKSKTYQNYRSFLKNKTRRLIVPYFVVSILWVAPAKQFFYQINIKEFIRAYILGEDAEQLWFLLMLFIVFVIAFPIADFIKEHFKIGVFICLLFFAIGLVAMRGMPNVFCYRTAFQYMIFFFLGFWMRQYDFAYRIPWIVWLVVNIVLFVFNRTIDTSSAIMMGVASIIQLLLHLAGTMFAFGFLQMLANMLNKGLANSKIWGTLSENAMGIYMFHMQIIYFTLFVFNGKLHPVSHALVNIIVSLSLSLAISMVLRRFKLTKFLLGG